MEPRKILSLKKKPTTEESIQAEESRPPMPEKTVIASENTKKPEPVKPSAKPALSKKPEHAKPAEVGPKVVHTPPVKLYKNKAEKRRAKRQRRKQRQKTFDYEPSVLAAAEELKSALERDYPALFPTDGTLPRPWKIGIHFEIMKKFGVESFIVKIAFALWLKKNRWSYLKAVSAGGQRYNLDGKPVGEITEEHVVIANAVRAKKVSVVGSKDLPEEQEAPL